MGGTIATLTAAGHEVSLYTLTRGENSRNGRILGLDPIEVGRRRAHEVEEASRILGIRRLMLADYPDGGLRDMDPRILERDIAQKIRELRPHVLCTFDVQGSSVHPDHITLHHVVKRLFVALREEIDALQRLCSCVLPNDRIAHWPRKVFGVPRHRINAVIDVRAARSIEEQALRAHQTVTRDVAEHNYDNWMLWDEEYFSFFQELHDPPVPDLFDGVRPV